MYKLCGKDALTFLGKDSPFNQVVFKGYDDGPTSGAVRCSSISEMYRFEMLATDFDGKIDWDRWNRGEELRVFSLAPLPAATFKRFADAISQKESRKSVCRYEPHFNDAYSFLDEAGPPELIIGSSGINAKILAVSQVSVDEIALVKDWFSFLGLTGSAQ